eukprot:8115722-Pyramimonas_sp.AAC.1
MGLREASRIAETGEWAGMRRGNVWTSAATAATYALLCCRAKPQMDLNVFHLPGCTDSAH